LKLLLTLKETAAGEGLGGGEISLPGKIEAAAVALKGRGLLIRSRPSEANRKKPPRGEIVYIARKVGLPVGTQRENHGHFRKRVYHGERERTRLDGFILLPPSERPGIIRRVGKILSTSKKDGHFVSRPTGTDDAKLSPVVRNKPRKER